MLLATTRRGFAARRPSVTAPALECPVLDVLTIIIIVLGTGVYLWLRRRKAGVSVDRAIAQGSAANAPLMSS
jgi:hypothetical protein